MCAKFERDIRQIKEEYARLVYDGQLIKALSEKMADEEREIDALRTSNLQAKKNIVLIFGSRFLGSYTDLQQLNAEESGLLSETFTTYPELLKTNEEALINCLYFMPAFAPEAPFLNVAKTVLLSDVIITFYVRCENRFTRIHADETWKSLIYLHLASKEDYHAFKEKVKAEKRRM